MIKVAGFLLDIEGVLVADKRYQAVEGAVGFVRAMRQHGTPFRLITNSTTDSRAALVEKLARAGFDFTLEELHTCTASAAAHLRSIGATRCLVLGTAALRAIFADEGFELTDDCDVDAVVVGLDTDLTYDRLRLACEAVLRHRAAFIALHRNRVYNDDQGRLAPSVGPIVEAVRYATQAEPTLIGKPGEAYFCRALDEVGLPPESVMVVSDDPLSDLTGAKRLGMLTAFVLSGKYPDRTVLDQLPAQDRPDLTTAHLADLLAERLISIDR